MWKHLVLCAILPFCLSETEDNPQVEVRVFRPRGFKLSIPDEEGITQIKVHINVNKPNTECCYGDISETVQFKTDDKWVYENFIVKLNKGDQLYYWIEVDRRKQYSYEYSITEFSLNNTTTPETTITHFPTTTPTSATPRQSNPTQSSIDCSGIIRNLSNDVVELGRQSAFLREENSILRELATRGAYLLRLIGTIVETGDPEDVVNFVLREKLDIEKRVKSATKVTNHTSIIFEVYSLDEKLAIIKKVKEKLKNSQLIAITYNI